MSITQETGKETIMEKMKGRIKKVSMGEGLT
jgi:hypothetical protein